MTADPKIESIESDPEFAEILGLKKNDVNYEKRFNEDKDKNVICATNKSLIHWIYDEIGIDTDFWFELTNGDRYKGEVVGIYDGFIVWAADKEYSNSSGPLSYPKNITVITPFHSLVAIYAK